MPRFAQGLRPGSPVRFLWPHFLALLTLLFSASVLPAQTPAPGRTQFPDSIKPVAQSGPVVQLKSSRPTITRGNLTVAEFAAPMQVEVAFTLRNFPELRSRLAAGRPLSPQELSARYLPLAADFDRVAGWLTAHGLKITHRDPSRLSLFVQGSVRQITETFQVAFARVALDGAEYSSAISAPSLPNAISAPILGINGLQPHLRMKPHARTLAQVNPSSTTANGPPFTPAQIAQAYNASGLTQTGSNQTIAIVIDTFPATSDLTAFWSACNVPQSLSNIDFIQVVNGTIPAPDLECSLDVEWTSSLAPSANIRVYATLDLELTDLDLAYEQIIADLPTQPNLHQLSLSYGGPENEFPDTELATDSQLFAILAASGVTVCVSSGDAGSRAGNTTSPLTPEAPCTDPSVTAVGGTSLNVDPTSGNVTSETAWPNSGGGISGFFPRPAWQTGPGVPAGTTRLVPDVAADADPNTGGIVYLNGESLQVGGTSLAAPTWAGFCALINQARADASLPPIGYLNPLLYPLNGSNNLRDITDGTNTDYSAGPGYDLVTGLGVPVVSNLLTTLISEPAIVTSPSGQEVFLNSGASFSVTTAGPGPFTYQWQRLPIGSSNWINLADNATYAGSATANLSVANTTAAMSGDQFQCIVTNSFANVTTFPLAILVVDVPMVITTFAGQPGVEGSANGLGTNATLNQPYGIGSDSGGNIYVADTYNQLIRKITPAGNVTTVAGRAGSSGSTNGSSTRARFSYPTGITADLSGNLYVAENGNSIIRKITPAGNVSTFAGTAGLTGNNNGLAGAARFTNPNGVAVDSSGNVFVADTGNSLVRKITSGGLVSTFAGQAEVTGSADGNATSAVLADPWGIAIDANKNLYVADTYNHTIRKITPAGNVTTIAGQPGVSGYNDGLATTEALFSYPTSVAIDSQGNIYVSDYNNNDIRVISPAGVVSTPAGDPEVSGNVDGTGPNAQFSLPFGVTLASGNLYITDNNNDTVRQGVLVTTPQIVTAPQNQTVLAGANATFALTVNATPAPAFQWQISTDGGATWTNLTDGGNISGSATSSLTVNATTTAMSGEQFRCLLSNPYGSATSANVTLTVDTPPAFTLQPVSLTVANGNSANFTVAATGNPAPAYQWLISTDSGSTWTPLTDNANYTGSATASLSIPNTTTTLTGAQYECLATNGLTPNATSSPATLTVNALTFDQTMAALGLTGANALPTARPFLDGIPNLARYAMNLGLTPSPSELPQTGSTNNNGTPSLTLTYRVLKGLVGVTVTVVSSTDLINWSPVSPTAITQLADPDPQTSLYQATVPLPPQPLFLRLNFTQTP